MIFDRIIPCFVTYMKHFLSKNKNAKESLTAVLGISALMKLIYFAYFTCFIVKGPHPCWEP